MTLIKELRIASRKSKLALWQANHVALLLNKLYPEISTRIIGITTGGDRILDKKLDEIGGKGLFVKELELALVDNVADLAVHSLKDMPSKLAAKFSLAATLKREDASDAFVSNKFLTLESMPNGTVLGTSSPRREAFIKKYYPYLRVKMLRGNIDSRINKLDNGEYDGIILATAGLKRLGQEQRIKYKLAVDKFIPAIAQGALALEILGENTNLAQMLLPLNDENTCIAVTMEREIGYLLGASCNVPIAVHAVIENLQIKVQAMLLDDTGKHSYFSEKIAPIGSYLEAAKECAESLLQQGAATLIQEYNRCI